MKNTRSYLIETNMKLALVFHVYCKLEKQVFLLNLDLKKWSNWMGF